MGTAEGGILRVHGARMPLGEEMFLTAKAWMKGDFFLNSDQFSTFLKLEQKEVRPAKLNWCSFSGQEKGYTIDDHGFFVMGTHFSATGEETSF